MLEERRHCLGPVVAILVGKQTKLLVQGITGSQGAFHAQQCRDYGTNVVGGVTPGKGGEKFDGSSRSYNTVRDAVKNTGANASMVFVPPPFAADAILEAIDAEVELVVCITEGIPVADMLKVRRVLDSQSKTAPDRTELPRHHHAGRLQDRHHARPHPQGRAASASSPSRGTLTYEAVGQLTGLGIGQSTCVGIGGDPINGTDFIDALKLFNDDKDTDGVIMIGEIGGNAEELAAEWIKANFKKPVAGFIAGATAPPGKRMGHAGAIISGGKGTAAEKIAALEAAGVKMAATPERHGRSRSRACSSELSPHKGSSENGGSARGRRFAFLAALAKRPVV